MQLNYAQITSFPMRLNKGLPLTNYFSASDFALSLNIPLWKYLDDSEGRSYGATGDWQLHHNNAPAHASRLVQSSLEKHQVTQVTQPSYSPDLVPCDFWLFPQIKSPLKRNRFQTLDEIQENNMGQLMVIETV